jgi:hypothetical protein
MQALDQIPDRLSRVNELFPAAITITRTSQADYGSRQLEVSLDGHWMATLLWGDSVTRELEPGSHSLRVHNTLVWKTVEFTLHPNEQLFFEAVNRAGPGTHWMTLVFGVGPLYVTLERMR